MRMVRTVADSSSNPSAGFLSPRTNKVNPETKSVLVTIMIEALTC